MAGKRTGPESGRKTENDMTAPAPSLVRFLFLACFGTL